MMNLKLISALSAVALSAMTSSLLAATTEAAPKPFGPSIPAINCEIKSFVACTADGCKPAETSDKVKLPIMLTIDLVNNAIASINPAGFAHIDKIDSIIKTNNQVISTGVDGEFAWQVLLSDKDQVVSLVLSTADTHMNGFGTCAVAK